MRVLVVLPTYNELQNLPRLLPALLGLDETIDVLVVDDSSPDGTGEAAEEFARREPRVRVLHRPGKLGLGTADVAGFEFALAHKYDRIVEMDADFSHRPEDLPAMLSAAVTADVVIGSRNIPGGKTVGWSMVRRGISRGGSLFARFLLKLPIKDCTSGFK